MKNSFKKYGEKKNKNRSFERNEKYLKDIKSYSLLKKI